MGLVTTPAIVLHAFPYSETSKIVRLATRHLGVQSALARGARRRRSGVGGRLETFSEGEAHLYVREHRDLHTLASFDVERERLGLAVPLARFAAASALAELQLRCAPAAILPAAYDVLREHLDLIANTPPSDLDAVGIRAIWRLVAALGFAPSLDACALDGAPLEVEGRVSFSTTDGGALCRRCGRGREGVSLPLSDFMALRALVSPGAVIPRLSRRHAAAHRRLLARFVTTHLAEGRPLTALRFWEHLT